MNDIKPITKPLDLIRIIGDKIVTIDVVRSEFPRESVVRKNLDSLRDTLDTCQRRLVREITSVTTDEFKKHTISLNKVNAKLHKIEKKLGEFSNKLETLVKFVKMVEKLVKLIPKPVG